MENKGRLSADEVSEDVEVIFQRGLKAWENFEENKDFKEAKSYIGEAKSKGHPLADMYWDIICAFEEANADSINKLEENHE